MSKDLKPKQRLGQTPGARRKRIIIWTVLGLAAAGASYAAYRNSSVAAPVEVPVAKVRRGDFVISVRTRGEIRATHSQIISAPQVPSLQITRLAESGRPVKKGDVIVEFDAAQQEQTYLEKNTSVRTVDSQIVQTKASHRITNEMDGMNLMTSQFNLERAKLDASKAEVVSEIEGAKSRIDVGISEGELGQVHTTIGSHKTSQSADIERLDQQRDKTVRDVDRAKGYLSKMVVRAPNDGIVSLLPNFRSQGSWGQAPPPFKEGDRAWTGAAIAEIPDLSEMRIDLKLDEVDRGKLRAGMPVRIRVDAIPDREFEAKLDWISPIAAVVWRGPGMTDKTFPAQGTLKKVDPRLRPGMSATAEILIESEPNSLLIPSRASFSTNGKPSVYIQRGGGFQVHGIEVGKRNETDIVVVKGLKDGDVVALENPAEVIKRAKKL